MLYLIGFDHIIQNIYAISGQFAEAPPATTLDLKQAFLRLLQEIQPSIPQQSAQRPALFVTNLEEEAALAAAFLSEEVVADRGLSAEGLIEQAEKTRKQQQMTQALNFLQSQHPLWHEIFQTAIHSVFFRDSPTAIGGSAARSIGVIWANVRQEWDLKDTVEFILHELTHNLLFIDELRYGHYTDYEAIWEKENFVPSAILQEQRPLDKALHSIIVTLEVWAARQDFLGENETSKVHFSLDRLRRKITDSLNNIHKMPNLKALLKPRGQELLDRCGMLIQRLEQDQSPRAHQS